MRGSRLLALLAVSLPQAGCCSLARFFCGPDRTDWISVNFETPEKAVRTLLEALRRDAPDVVYLCLSNDYRRRLEIDQLKAQLAWQKIREQNPGLHVAGYATVPAAVLHGCDRAEIHLDVEGHALDVQLVRESRWRVRYRRDNGTQGEPGASINSFAGFVRLEPIDNPNGDADQSKLTIQPLTINHTGIEHLPLESLEFVGFERLWKIADLHMPQP